MSNAMSNTRELSMAQTSRKSEDLQQETSVATPQSPRNNSMTRQRSVRQASRRKLGSSRQSARNRTVTVSAHLEDAHDTFGKQILPACNSRFSRCSADGVKKATQCRISSVGN